ncbi:hypothetical protein Bca52824_081656 [Brassica carinata]|uniref:Ubiquitin-like protease family profile domain-containing protein n=1 Tax=Brassica carinata TaxID=52824 RepID=A0A8X7TR72_BRACI|nr:hypothetical protein Bca52824_081656 [Brassica carinata]
MASASTTTNYPQRLYKKGKTPNQQKSMSYYSYLSNFQIVEVGVGNDAWDALKKSSVGVFPRLYELDFIWSTKVVHYLLTHQLVVRKNYEIWSLIDWQPIRLSLLEFGEITGLNCDMFDDGDLCKVDHKEFWAELNVCTTVGPSLNELQLVLGRCKNWSLEKRIMVGRLCILHIAIFGIAPTRRIPLECAKRVLDFEAFERYSWGRVACKSLIHSIKCVSYDAKKSYTMEGFVYVLLIWGYEAVTGLGEQYGNKIVGAEVPLLSWAGSRKWFVSDDFIRQEKIEHEDKVRVRPFFSHIDENLVPKWDGELEHENVNHLIRDILDDYVNRKAWDLVETSVTKRTKRKESIPMNVSEDSANKDKKAKPMGDGRYNADDNDTPSTAMLTMLKTDRKTIGTKVDVIIAPLIEKFAILEMEMRKMKGKMVPEERKEAANSNVNINEEVTSDAMSWMVEIKSTSQDGIPARHVVKKVTKTCKKGGDMGLDKNNLFENKVFKTKIQVPHLLDTASEETWSDTKQREKIRKVSDGLDAIAAAARKFNKPTSSTPQPKRQTKLASSQLFPFIGNSTVKRIITGVIPSVSAYDPFAVVEDTKIRNLLHFLLDDEEEPDRTSECSVEFYKVLITPREEWRTPTYGWLTNWRIVFLDQCVVIKLVSDFKEFNPKTWSATDIYKGIFNGTYPADRITNKNILSIVEDNKEIRNVCRPFAKMIPTILNAMVPTTLRKKSDKQFAVRRLITVPQNEKPGDCGVYTIKYIECLAIGCTFEGLSDKNIPDIRKNLAAEIYVQRLQKQLEILTTAKAIGNI